MSTQILELSARNELTVLPTYSFAPSLVVLGEHRSGAAEAIRVLRNYILTHQVQEGRRALAVCAASEGVGCTFVAANLAVGMAQIGVRTLLIDANMRSGGVDQLMQGGANGEGLAQCLSDPAPNFTRFIVPDVLPNLSVLFSGGTVANAQDLLAGAQFEELMYLALRKYELTILDTPPANSCADSRLVAGAIGYSLLVARENKTYVQDLNVLADQLREDRVRVIGSVLNKE